MTTEEREIEEAIHDALEFGGYGWGVEAFDRILSERDSLRAALERAEEMHLLRDHIPGERRSECQVCIPMLAVLHPALTSSEKEGSTP